MFQPPARKRTELGVSGGSCLLAMFSARYTVPPQLDRFMGRASDLPEQLTSASQFSAAKPKHLFL